MNCGMGCNGGMGDIWDTINTGITQAGNILSARYSVPQLNQGQMIQTRDGMWYQGNPNNSTYGLPNLSVGGGFSSSGMLPLLLIGGVALLMMKGR